MFNTLYFLCAISIHFHFTEQTNFQLFLQAFDEDVSVDDFLDNIFIEGSLNDSTLSPVTTVSGSRSRVKMRVQFQRVCQANYYNVNCSTFCLAADDNTGGHYTCNERDGSKLCLQGYEGVDCLESKSSDISASYLTCLVSEFS